jgi:hypothetical protein
MQPAQVGVARDKQATPDQRVAAAEQNQKLICGGLRLAAAGLLYGCHDDVPIPRKTRNIRMRAG